jgi:2-oxoglutarate ferredoxin oxidoreductase subunit gamma
VVRKIKGLQIMNRTEIRLSGFGGQGIILAAFILGKAAALHDHKHATMTQNYGPESRGGACSGQVIVSDAPVSYPHLTHPNVVVAMSQEAYAKYAGELVDGGLLLIDQDLVHVNGGKSNVRLFCIPATRIAEQDLNRKMVANIVMLGFLAALDSSVSPDAMRKSVRESVPKGSEALNLDAFERGFEHGRKLLAESHKEGMV